MRLEQRAAQLNSYNGLFFTNFQKIYVTKLAIYHKYLDMWDAYQHVKIAF